MRKPPRSVMSGLATLAGVVESGSSADILGFDDDGPAATAEDRKAWADVLAAVQWIRERQQLDGTAT